MANVVLDLVAVAGSAGEDDGRRVSDRAARRPMLRSWLLEWLARPLSTSQMHSY